VIGCFRCPKRVQGVKNVNDASRGGRRLIRANVSGGLGASGVPHRWWRDWTWHTVAIGGQDRSNNVERYRAPQRTDRVQRRRNSDDDDVKTAKKTPAPEESKEAKSRNENSSIVTVGSDHDKTTPVTEQRKTDLAKSDKSTSSNENSTIATIASTTMEPVKVPATNGEAVATCKRYLPTAGQTVTVPCD